MSEVSGKWFIDQEKPDTDRRPRGHLSGGGAVRLDRRAVDTAGTLLPVDRRPGRPSKWTKRQLIDGIRWRTRAGAPWRDMPHQYGSWSAVYALFRRWQCDGTWQRLLTALQAKADAAGRITWHVSVDSTTARAHQHAAGARKRGICSQNHLVESARNRPIMRLADLAVA